MRSIRARGAVRAPATAAGLLAAALVAALIAAGCGGGGDEPVPAAGGAEAPAAEERSDAPSGSAGSAGASGEFVNVRAEKELIEGPRGGDYEGISVHSARMPGRVAHHELVFGGLGQTLTIRHDSVSRESFMPGVTMAIREVVGRTGLTVGLEKLMGLG